MLNFVLCDDNNHILCKLSKMVESIFIQNNFEANVCFQTTEADELLNYVQNNKVDVLILDINLKSSISGIDLAEQIRLHNKDIYIIFTTGHLEYALIAYKVKTFDYLSKPVTFERLEITIKRLFDDISNLKSNFIPIGKTQIIVNENDILYIKKEGMKLIYHTINKDYTTYISLNQLKNQLSQNFFRCHKSYIANMINIENIDCIKNFILFNNGDCCPIGPKYKIEFMEVFKQYGNFANDYNCIHNT